MTSLLVAAAFQSQHIISEPSNCENPSRMIIKRVDIRYLTDFDVELCFVDLPHGGKEPSRTTGMPITDIKHSNSGNRENCDNMQWYLFRLVWHFAVIVLSKQQQNINGASLHKRPSSEGVLLTGC